jgi:hypothetical protein
MVQFLLCGSVHFPEAVLLRMSASLDVKTHAWEPQFKVILIAAALEAVDIIIFTAWGVFLDHPERRR